jgi:outer membrane protein OmpA-like peptidoglycan-associated protein
VVAAALAAGCAANRPLVANPSDCVDTAFPIYFEEGSDQLTQPALQVLAQTATRMKSCRITEARVLGLADAGGTNAANMAVSQGRARKVTEALAAQGLPAPQFEVAAAGAQGAVTPEGAAEPVRRRTEVLLRVTR